MGDDSHINKDFSRLWAMNLLTLSPQCVQVLFVSGDSLQKWYKAERHHHFESAPNLLKMSPADLKYIHLIEIKL